MKFLSDEVVLILEDFHAVFVLLKDVPVTIVVFCQNHFLLFAGLRDYVFGA